MTLPAGARDARPVGGGDINEAYRVVLSDGREAFVKTRADAVPGEYAAEAAGLRWLAEPGALRVPRVLEACDGHLALEWVERGSLSTAGAEELGRGLAKTHAAGAPGFGAFAPAREQDGEGAREAPGVEVGWLGSLQVSNAPAPTWPEFYVERRLRPLAALARERGALDERASRTLERVCERMRELTGPAQRASRLHGDLWAGNALAGADGRPWLIDPCAYGGDREVDLAMLALFGAPAGALEAYREAAPLADGWRERVGLYQLLPLLVHALLFGGAYGDALVRTARRYA